MTSEPSSPQIRSLPPFPSIVSSLADPTITSLPEVPPTIPLPATVAGFPKHVGPVLPLALVTPTKPTKPKSTAPMINRRKPTPPLCDDGYEGTIGRSPCSDNGEPTRGVPGAT